MVSLVQEHIKDLWRPGGATMPELLNTLGVEGFVVSWVAGGNFDGVGCLSNVFHRDDLGFEGERTR